MEKPPNYLHREAWEAKFVAASNLQRGMVAGRDVFRFGRVPHSPYKVCLLLTCHAPPAFPQLNGGNQAHQVGGCWGGGEMAKCCRV
jgi:hypothetical protein